MYHRKPKDMTEKVCKVFTDCVVICFPGVHTDVRNDVTSRRTSCGFNNREPTFLQKEKLTLLIEQNWNTHCCSSIETAVNYLAIGFECQNDIRNHCSASTSRALLMTQTISVLITNPFKCSLLVQCKKPFRISFLLWDALWKDAGHYASITSFWIPRLIGRNGWCYSRNQWIRKPF